MTSRRRAGGRLFLLSLLQKRQQGRFLWQQFVDLERLDWTVIKTSAKTGADVDRAFTTLADAMLSADGIRHEPAS